MVLHSALVVFVAARKISDYSVEHVPGSPIVTVHDMPVDGIHSSEEADIPDNHSSGNTASDSGTVLVSGRTFVVEIPQHDQYDLFLDYHPLY